MQVYACKLIPKEDQEIFYWIEKIIQLLPEINLGKDLVSCHMLTRALARFFPVEVHDGYFCKEKEFHSWLTTENVIIDVYPIATIGGPIMIDRKTPNPWLSLYIAGEIPKIAFGKNEKVFSSHVQEITTAIRQIIGGFYVDEPQKDF